MTPFIVSLMLTVGVTTWIYNKFMKTTGNDTPRSLTAAITAGVIIFVISFVFFYYLLV